MTWQANFYTLVQTGGCRKEIKRWSAITKSAMAKLTKICKSYDINIQIKIRLVWSNHALKCWTLKESWTLRKTYESKSKNRLRSLVNEKITSYLRTRHSNCIWRHKNVLYRIKIPCYHSDYFLYFTLWFVSRLHLLFVKDDQWHFILYFAPYSL